MSEQTKTSTVLITDAYQLKGHAEALLALARGGNLGLVFFVQRAQQLLDSVANEGPVLLNMSASARNVYSEALGVLEQMAAWAR